MHVVQLTLKKVYTDPSENTLFPTEDARGCV